MSEKISLSKAHKIIDPFVFIGEKSPGPVTSRVRKAAQIVIEETARTPEGQNDIFCIAICCDLDVATKRKAAWNLLTNMANGNFRWITLYNYSVEHAWWIAGIIKEMPEKIHGNSVSRVEFYSWDLHRQIVEIFNLPTTRYHPDKILTHEQALERVRYNSLYPITHSASCAL